MGRHDMSVFMMCILTLYHVRYNVGGVVQQGVGLGAFIQVYGVREENPWIPEIRPPHVLSKQTTIQNNHNCEKPTIQIYKNRPAAEKMQAEACYCITSC